HFPSHGVKEKKIEAYGENAGYKQQSFIGAGSKCKHQSEKSQSDLIDDHFDDGVGMFPDKIDHKK
ncbi:MAG: hypothetical protein J6I45_12380, partial [Clostridia bacterium]|nr:hypothetical protein [Clostridia bacterium]